MGFFFGFAKLQHKTAGLRFTLMRISAYTDALLLSPTEEVKRFTLRFTSVFQSNCRDWITHISENNAETFFCSSIELTFSSSFAALSPFHFWDLQCVSQIATTNKDYLRPSFRICLKAIGIKNSLGLIEFGNMAYNIGAFNSLCHNS